MTVRFRTFRKYRRPCGQPAVVGGMVRFRPVPPQTAHFTRIKATPSDLPFKSTGFATYPLPPQFGQSSGATRSPLSVETIVKPIPPAYAQECFALRITNNPQLCQWIPANAESKFFFETKVEGASLLQ